MRPLLIVAAIAAATVAAPLAAQQAAPQAAQPAATEYDQNAIVTLDGKVDTIELSGQTSKLVLQPTTGTQMWDIALPDISTLIKKGISASNLNRGASVKVRAYKAKDTACTPDCKAQGVDLTLAGGQPIDLLSPVAPDPAPTAGGQGGGGGRGGRRGG